MPKDDTEISAEVVVEIVSEAQTKQTPEAHVTAKLIEAGLSAEEIAHAYQMFSCGQSRAAIETMGATATADYDTDPIFRAALKKAQEKLPPSGRPRTRKRILAVVTGAAILVGLFALGAVVYAVLSLVRESQ